MFVRQLVVAVILVAGVAPAYAQTTRVVRLTTTDDVDWYQFNPQGNDEVSVRLRTAGLSLLNARVSVYDSAGTLLQSVSSQGLPGVSASSTSMTGIPSRMG